MFSYIEDKEIWFTLTNSNGEQVVFPARRIVSVEKILDEMDNFDYLLRLDYDVTHLLSEEQYKYIVTRMAGNK